MMYYDVEIDEEEVLEKTSFKKIKREIESRGYVVIEEDEHIEKSDTPIRMINNIKNILNLKEHSTIDDILKEINDLKNYV